MKQSVESWYSKQDEEGNCIAHLRFEFSTANVELRNRLIAKIQRILNEELGDNDEKEEKQPAIGFDVDTREEE